MKLTEELLTRIRNNDGALVSIDLSGDGIDDIGAGKLADALKKNKTLRDIDLSENNIGNAGAEKLRKALEVNKFLVKIKLSSNNFDMAHQVFITTYINRNIILEMDNAPLARDFYDAKVWATSLVNEHFNQIKSLPEDLRHPPIEYLCKAVRNVVFIYQNFPQDICNFLAQIIDPLFTETEYYNKIYLVLESIVEKENRPLYGDLAKALLSLRQMFTGDKRFYKHFIRQTNQISSESWLLKFEKLSSIMKGITEKHIKQVITKIKTRNQIRDRYGPYKQSADAIIKPTNIPRNISQIRVSLVNTKYSTELLKRKQLTANSKLSKLRAEYQQLSQQSKDAATQLRFNRIEKQIQLHQKELQDLKKNQQASEKTLKTLQQEYQERHAKTLLHKALMSQPHLKIFYCEFKEALTNEIFAHKAIASKRVQHAATMIDDAAKGVSGVGSLISLPLISGLLKGTAGSIEFVNQRKQRGQAKQVSKLAIGIEEVNALIEKTSRFITLRYQDPLAHLLNDDAQLRCARHAITMIITDAREGKYENCDNTEQLISAFLNSLLKQPTRAKRIKQKAPKAQETVKLKMSSTKINIYDFWRKPGVCIETGPQKYEYYGDPANKKTSHNQLGFYLVNKTDSKINQLQKLIISGPKSFISISTFAAQVVLRPTSSSATTTGSVILATSSQASTNKAQNLEQRWGWDQQSELDRLRLEDERKTKQIANMQRQMAVMMEMLEQKTGQTVPKIVNSDESETSDTAVARSTQKS